MAYAYKEKYPGGMPWRRNRTCRRATCKYGGIILSVMRMNKIFPIDRKEQTITAEPGALLIDIRCSRCRRRGLFYPAGSGRKNSFHRRQCYHKCRWYEGGTIWTDGDFVRCIEAVMRMVSIMNFFIQRCEEHNGI